jgi:hypothetical protein
MKASKHIFEDNIEKDIDLKNHLRNTTKLRRKKCFKILKISRTSKVVIQIMMDLINKLIFIWYKHK